MNEDYEFNLAAVRKQLRLQNARHSTRRGYAYRSVADFLMQHGIDYPPTPWRGLYSQGKAKMCFGNAMVLGALNGLRYVEGMTLSPTGLAIPHAWNLSAEGELIDSTWLNRGLVYLGVEFSLERADDALWNGDGSVLDDWKRRWPLFKQRWTGEDYNLTWPASDRLDALRSANPTVPASVIEWESLWRPCVIHSSQSRGEPWKSGKERV